MTRAVSVRFGIVLLAFVSALSRPGAASVERILLDAPRGAWLAAVRSDAPMIVIEERNGWRRVRIEGWVPATDASAPAEPSPRGVVVGGARVRGVLLAPGDVPSASAGSGLIVMLLSDLEVLDREHAAVGDECRSRLKEINDRVESLQGDLARALNSSDNLRQATERSDRLKAQIAQAGKERTARLRDCRSAADTLLERHAVQKGITDGNGAFEFDGIASGRYRVYAADPSGDPPRTWLLECKVTAPSDAIVLDPRHDRSAIDPYWGLR